MGYTAKQLLATAIAEIDYHEKASNANLDDKTANSGSNNYTKYARDLTNAGYYNGSKQGYAWCDQFVDWCHYVTAGKNKTIAEATECQTGIYGAGCTYSMQYYQNQNRLDKNPQAGDQIFFRWSGNSGADHTGIVEYVSNGQVHTIEGNTGNNKVERKSYSTSYSCIVGYGHPKYDAAAAVTLKSTAVVAQEVLDGKWGTGSEREAKLAEAGYDYATIQAAVNALVKAKSTTTTTSTSKATTSTKPTTTATTVTTVTKTTKATTTTTSASTFKSYTAVVNATDGLNVRKGAGTNYDVIKTLPNGTKITVQKEQNGWGYIDSGWVYLTYTSKNASAANSFTAYNAKVVAKSGLNIRKTPSLSGAKISAYGYGTTVKITAESNGWGQTDKGWILLQWVKKV